MQPTIPISDISIPFLKKIFEDASTGFAFVDTDFCYLHINPFLAKMNKVAIDDHIGKSVADIIGANHWQMQEPHFRAALAGEVILDRDFTGTVQHDPFGKIVHTRAAFHGVFVDNAPTGVAVIVVDRTAEMEAQIALKVLAERQQRFLHDVLFSVTDGRLNLCADSDSLPLPLLYSSEWISLGDPMGIRTLRRQLNQMAEEYGLSVERIQDLETAAGEAAMNAVVHGGGGKARVCINDRGVAQVWVSDGGKGIQMENLPRATLERGYTTAGTMGMGMKMMLKTVDRIYLLTGVEGTTLVLEQEKEIPMAQWMRDTVLLPGEIDSLSGGNRVVDIPPI